jgi:hypothetical protein
LAKNDPATGAAPVWVSLQKRCLSCSAKPEEIWAHPELHRDFTD